MIERVDPYELAEEPRPLLRPSPEDLLRARLHELRARIAALDTQVAGLMTRREELTRAVFEAAVASRDERPA